MSVCTVTQFVMWSLISSIAWEATGDNAPGDPAAVGGDADDDDDDNRIKWRPTQGALYDLLAGIYPGIANTCASVLCALPLLLCSAAVYWNQPLDRGPAHAVWCTGVLSLTHPPTPNVLPRQ